MFIVEVTPSNLRQLDEIPATAPSDGFIWIYLDRTAFMRQQSTLQLAAQNIGGSQMLDVHTQDLTSDVHPSNYDGTSIYDLIIFRRLATLTEVRAEQERENEIASYHSKGIGAYTKGAGIIDEAFARIDSKAVGFAIYDKLLISVHPGSCSTADNFIQKISADSKLNTDPAATASVLRNRIPQSPTDLVLRLITTMVDGYLDLRRQLTSSLEKAQTELLRSTPHPDTWSNIMQARKRLQVLEELCEEQQDAMQEWTDTLRETPLSAFMTNGAGTKQATAKRDQQVAQARNVMEHIERVLHHVRRLEQSAETAVQIHFAAQGQRTNDTMRALTAVTAIFLPLNLFTGFFGMNFDHLPLIHSTEGMWLALILLTIIAAGILAFFWKNKYFSN